MIIGRAAVLSLILNRDELESMYKLISNFLDNRKLTKEKSENEISFLNVLIDRTKIGTQETGS